MEDVHIECELSLTAFAPTISYSSVVEDLEVVGSTPVGEL